jgi:predicted small secreted protein
MKTFFKTLVSLFLLTALLAGCENTLQGVGRDMQQNGKAIQRSTQ